MNKPAKYHLKIQHCREMARRANGPLEKECWLIVADGWARLLHMMELSNHRSVQLMHPQAESNQTKDEGSLPPRSVNFCQFSLVDRQVQSPSQAASSLMSLFRGR